MTDRRFEMFDPDQDPTKVPGYCWVEVDHEIIDRQDGVYAIVPVRCRFVGKEGNIVDTPAVGLSVDSAEQLARNILDHAQAAKLKAQAACGDEDAAHQLDQLARQWDDENLTRIYGN